MSLFGMLPLDSGTIRVTGKDVKLRGVRDAIAAGIAYVPEDRLTEGLFLSRSIGENITVSEMENFTTLLSVPMMVLVFLSVLILGIILTAVSAYWAVNRYIRMDRDDLYYI